MFAERTDEEFFQSIRDLTVIGVSHVMGQGGVEGIFLDLVVVPEIIIFQTRNGRQRRRDVVSDSKDDLKNCDLIDTDKGWRRKA